METQYISLNMTPTGVNPCFHISQYDVGRMLGFIVHSGGATVDLDTYTCTIEATRSDGTAITSAVATTDNIGTFEVTPTMSNKADKYRCQFIIVDENSKRIASLPFDMEVTKAAMDENSEAIEEDASLYQQYTETVQTIIAQTRADIVAETNRAEVAETTLQENIDTEAVARVNAVDTERSARIAAVSAETSARQAADNTLQNNINTEAATRASADSNLQSQINQIIAPSGEAPSAAEVQNARIGADGTVYDTLGNAIRTQNIDLKNTLTYNIDQITKSTQNIADVGTAKIGVAWNGNKNSARAIIEIPAEPNTTYTVSYGSENQLDAINVFEMQMRSDTSSAHAHTISTSPTTFTTLPTTHVFVVQFNKTDIAFNDIVSAQLQIEKGNVATDFVPALVPVDYYARKDIDAVEGNLIDTDDHLSAITTETYNLADLFELRVGTAWNLNTDADRATLFIPCEPEQRYTVSHDTNGELSDIVYFELSEIGATSYLYSTSLLNRLENVHTTDASCNVIAIGFNKSNITLDDVKAINLQIVEGNAKRYIPAVSAIDQYVRNNMVTFVTPEMYGAFGDGVHDDTEYLQAALNSGKPVRAYGSYLTSESLIIDSSARTGIDFEFQYINYTGTNYAIKLYGRNGRITGNCLNADNGHGIDIGSMGLVYQMNIDITLVRIPNGVCYKMGGSEPVSECVISGNRCAYGIYGVLFVLDNYWVGQNTFMNMDFTTDKESAGYAFFANGARHPLTGLTCYNISLEGSHGGFEFVNSMPGAPIETLNCFGLRTSEMSITNHYNIIRYTGFGVIRGKMFIDLANIENFDFSGATNNINMLTVEGRIKKGDRNFTKAYFRKGNYILEDMEDMPYTEGVYTQHATVDSDGNVIISYS